MIFILFLFTYILSNWCPFDTRNVLFKFNGFYIS